MPHLVPRYDPYSSAWIVEEWEDDKLELISRELAEGKALEWCTENPVRAMNLHAEFGIEQNRIAMSTLGIRFLRYIRRLRSEPIRIK